MAAQRPEYSALMRRRRRNPSRRRGGFVLIEVLAAFVILTIALTALMSGVSGAIRNDDRANFLLRATRAARSQLDALGVETPPPSGVTTGQTDDGLAFAMTVSVIDSPQIANPFAPKIMAYWAHIDVTRSGEVTGKTLTIGFDTFKIRTIEKERAR